MNLAKTGKIDPTSGKVAGYVFINAETCSPGGSILEIGGGVSKEETVGRISEPKDLIELKVGFSGLIIRMSL